MKPEEKNITNSLFDRKNIIYTTTIANQTWTNEAVCQITWSFRRLFRLRMLDLSWPKL